MSLTSLMTNYFSVASNKFAGQDQVGAVDRDFSYVFIYKNIPCAIQGKNRINTEQAYGKKEDVIQHIFFHQNYNLQLETGADCLIVTYLDWRAEILNFEDKVNLRVFEYIGKRDPVGHKNQRVPLEIITEETTKWKL